MTQPSTSSSSSFDHLFKILLVGDSGVGKSSILMRFTTDNFEDMSPTIGVDFKLKMLELEGKRLKLTIWDTAGQERFRTLTSSYYRGAQGIIFAYDVTRKDTFKSLQELWMSEVDMYSTIPDAIKMVVGNKVDRSQDRQVTKEEGKAFARQHGCLFIETSAKENVKIAQTFEELVLKMLETPQLVEDSHRGKGINLQQQRDSDASSGGCC